MTQMAGPMSILGDFATLYLMGTVAVFMLGVLGLTATRQRRRYARMVTTAPLWPAVGIYLLMRPATRRPT